jgi:hypothetical protein
MLSVCLFLIATSKGDFLGRDISGTTFLGMKQEGLTIVHFLEKLIVSCKEAVRVSF